MAMSRPSWRPMSSVTTHGAGASSFVTIRKPFALILSTAARRFGTPKPRWSTELPLEPPVGFCSRSMTSTFGNLTIWRPATVIGVPPSVSPKNFRLAGMLVTLRWWWPYATGASLAASSCAALGDAATNRHSARALQVSLKFICLLKWRQNPTALPLQKTGGGPLPRSGGILMPGGRPPTPTVWRRGGFPGGKRDEWHASSVGGSRSVARPRRVGPRERACRAARAERHTRPSAPPRLRGGSELAGASGDDEGGRRVQLRRGRQGPRVAAAPAADDQTRGG